MEDSKTTLREEPAEIATKTTESLGESKDIVVERSNLVVSAPETKKDGFGGGTELNKSDLEATMLFHLKDEHQGVVRGCAFSPDAKVLCTVSEDRSVIVWDVIKGYKITTLRGHSDAVCGCAFSPTDPFLATCGSDSTVKIWSTETWKEIKTLRHAHAGTVRSVTFSPDGAWIATASDDHTCSLWDIESGKSVGTFEHIDYVYDCAFSPSGGYLATASRDKTCKLWDLATLELAHTLTGHTGFVWGCTFSEDETCVLTASEDKSCKVWNVQQGVTTQTFSGHSDEVNCVVYAENSSVVLTASDDGTVRCWDYASPSSATALLMTVRAHPDRVTCCAFAKNSGLLATSSADGTSKIFAINTLMAPVCKVEGPSTPVEVGISIELRALVKGAPPPELMWMKDGVPLRNEMEQTLRIPSTDGWHAGTYTCVATNQCGKSEDSLDLEVVGLRSRVDNLGRSIAACEEEIAQKIEIVRRAKVDIGPIDREIERVRRAQEDTNARLDAARRELASIQRQIEELERTKEAQSVRADELKSVREDTVSTFSDASSRVEALEREREGLLRAHAEAQRSERNALEAEKFCETASRSQDLPAIIKIASSYPDVFPVQQNACTRLRDALVMDPMLYEQLPQPDTNDFLRNVEQRFPLALGCACRDLALLISRACPSVVQSMRDLDAGMLLSLPLSEDFQFRAAAASTALADVTRMATRAALPLLERFDSAVAKVLDKNAFDVIDKYGAKGLGPEVRQATQRMRAIFDQFDRINLAAASGGAREILEVFAGRGDDSVSVSAVHHGVMTIAQISFAVAACKTRQGIEDSLATAEAAVRLASGRRLDRMALAAANMYAVASFLSEAGFADLFATMMDQNVHSPDALVAVMDLETLMAPPFLLKHVDAVRFIKALETWTPPISSSERAALEKSVSSRGY